MSTNMEDQDRLESHAVDNVLNDDEHQIEEEKANYTIDANEEDGVDKSNIVERRTRGAGQPKGTYQEPDENKIDEDAQGNAYIKQ